MKTYFSTLKNIVTNVAISAAMVLATLSFTSCADSSDEPEIAAVGDTTVTFTYTVPEDIFKYVEITVCHNNDAGTDALWFPMLENTVTVSYQISKLPAMIPVVLVYDKTNRPAYGVTVDWDLIMEIEVSRQIDGQTVTEYHREVYNICGDLGSAIDTLIKQVTDRTYAVKISKDNDVEYI